MNIDLIVRIRDEAMRRMNDISTPVSERKRARVSYRMSVNTLRKVLAADVLESEIDPDGERFKNG